MSKPIIIPPDLIDETYLERAMDDIFNELSPEKNKIDYNNLDKHYSLNNQFLEQVDKELSMRSFEDISEIIIKSAKEDKYKGINLSSSILRIIKEVTKSVKIINLAQTNDYKDTLRFTEELIDDKENRLRVYNSGLFKTKLRELVNKSENEKKPLCLAIWDIDDFKLINDHPDFGHPGGDHVIYHIVQRSYIALEKKANSSNFPEIVARDGGDENKVLFPEIGIKEASEKCIAIKKEVESTPIIYQGKKANITLSIGCAEYSSIEYKGHNRFHSEVDRLLYLAKIFGKNRIVTKKRVYSPKTNVWDKRPGE